MREILFRAKAINRDPFNDYRTNYKNGDWVYGLITQQYDERFETLPAEMTNTNGVSGIEVDYKTIGQFTGLTDKNGKKIFEGDILTSDFFPYTSDDGKKEYLSEVVWFFDNVPMPAFGLSTFKNHKPSVRDFDYLYNNGLWEVIGNIYDNPNLLKDEGESE